MNGVQFTMIAVKGCTFQMGSTSGESNEKPVHNVTLSNYYVGQTEVTQALWKAVMGKNQSYNKGDNLPVEQVSYNDCQEFITKLNELTGKTFRLPTEAEWEFAAKGGTKKLNELGIYDMSGNVFEWCQDWYGSYSNSAQTNPTGPHSDFIRMDRGGSWDLDASYCRTANRDSFAPTFPSSDLGLRLAL